MQQFQSGTDFNENSVMLVDFVIEVLCSQQPSHNLSGKKLMHILNEQEE